MTADNATAQRETADANAEKGSDLAISSQASETGKVQRLSREGVGPSGPKRAARSLADRFSRKVLVGPGCHEWTGYIAPNGYGQIRQEGGTGYAHRVAWELAFGPIPAGRYVLHRCDNRKCVNAEHLFLGDHLANIADMVSKGRHARGSTNAHAKLSDEQVRNIRAMAGTDAEIAKQFGVSRPLVSMIQSRRIWRHV